MVLTPTTNTNAVKPQIIKLQCVICRFRKIYPVTINNTKYLTFGISSNTYKIEGKRGKPVNFNAVAYGLGSVFGLFKKENKQIYAGKNIEVEGYFDESLGSKAFRVLDLNYEDLSKYLAPDNPDVFAPELPF